MRTSVKLRSVVYAISLVMVGGLAGAYAHAAWSSRGFSLTGTFRNLYADWNGQSVEKSAQPLPPTANSKERTISAIADSRSLECLNRLHIDEYREDPNRADVIFGLCDAELRARLGPKFGALETGDRFVIFAAILAHRTAPYGNSGATKFRELLSEPHLDCDNYAALAGHIVTASARVSTNGPAKFYVVGFDGGAVGNHAQIFYVRDEIELLLDPTIGLIAVTSFDDVLRGQPVAAAKVRSFYAWEDPEIEGFRQRVIKALTNGEYRPSDLLYFYESFDHFLGKLDDPRHIYITPGGMSLRSRS